MIRYRIEQYVLDYKRYNAKGLPPTTVTLTHDQFDRLRAACSKTMNAFMRVEQDNKIFGMFIHISDEYPTSRYF